MNAQKPTVESRPSAPRAVPLDAFVNGIFYTLGAVLCGVVIGRLLPRERVHVVLVDKEEESE